MNNSELVRRLKQIKIENFIWLIYIGIIFLSWYGNSFEEDYFLFGNDYDKEKYRHITIVIFVILIVVYLYFLSDSFKDIQNLKESDSDEKKMLTYLSFLGSLFIAISGFIFLYIAISDEELNVEIAFN